MDDEDKNKDDKEIWIPPDLPGLDCPILSDDSLSNVSSVLKAADIIYLSKYEALVANEMMRVSESEESDELEKDSPVVLKNCPNNQALIFKSNDGTIVGSINDDQDFDKATTSSGKNNTSSPVALEDLIPKVSNFQIEDKGEKGLDAKTILSETVILRTSSTNINYDEQSEDDGDFSATEGSDYILDSDEKSTTAKKGLTKRIKKIKRNLNKNSNFEKANTLHSSALVTVPDTPESSFEKSNTVKPKRPFLICDETIEKDLSSLHLDKETNRSLDENTNNSFAAEILRDVSNYNLEFGGGLNVQDQVVAADMYITSERQGTSKRNWNRRNCCIYCDTLVTNFTRHLIRNHTDEPDVLKLIAIKDDDPKVQKKNRQAFTTDLRNRGNYIHNSNVAAGNEGYLIPSRRKNNEELARSPSGFVVCKNCLGTYRRTTFYRHCRKCIGNDFKTQNSLSQNAISIIPNFKHASKEFTKNILPRLRNDDISLIVKHDPLIISYGCRLLKKKKERRSRKVICSKMRDLAHLLKILREKNPDICQLEQLFDPKFYEDFIGAVKKICGFNEETGFVEITSMPARIRPAVLGCIDILFTNTIMDSQKSTALKEHTKTKLSEFKMLLEANWQWEISSNAEKTRKRNLMTKPHVMPLDKDIKKLIIKIHDLEETYYHNLKKDVTNVNYENLCELTIAHIILLDRKRSGDVAEAELQFYINRKTDDIPTEILESLDLKQKKAMSDLDIFQIPGKRGRSVPVLITQTMRRNIDLLVASRSTLNISYENKYLFARPLTEAAFDGAKCLNRIKSLCNLKKPEMLTSTGLRHHIATLSQVHADSDDKYTQHLATFLGHDMQVHASNYRLPLQAIQKGLVGSRLMEVENLSKNQNDSLIEGHKKKLESETGNDKENNIEKKKQKKKSRKKLKKTQDDDSEKSEFEEDTGIDHKHKKHYSRKKFERQESKVNKKRTNDEIKAKTTPRKVQKLQSSDSITSVDKVKPKRGVQKLQSSDTETSIETVIPKKYVRKVHSSNSTDHENIIDLPLNTPTNKTNKTQSKNIQSDDESDEELAEQKPKRRKKTHKKWSAEEIDAVMKHLKKFIKMKKNPGKALCVQVLRKEPVLHNRTWMQINTYINNIYKKNL